MIETTATVITRPHHTVFFGELYMLWQIVGLPKEEQRQRIHEHTDLLVNDTEAAQTYYGAYGGAKDIIGETVDERAIYEEREFQLLQRIAAFSLDQRVTIRPDAKALLCLLNINGRHCEAYKTVKRQVLDENRNTDKLFEELSRTGGYVSRRGAQTDKGIKTLVTTWGTLLEYWRHEEQSPGGQNLRRIVQSHPFFRPSSNT